ncbi:MAG: rRNA maturation RNase YbeY [Victivallales bacterium]|nr:rRNA maturation RNase YbeY [Victivallales bacterium]
MNIRLSKERGSYPLHCRERLKRILSYAQELAGLGTFKGTLNVVVTTKATMQAMNWDFLRHEGATDVLTFDLREQDQQFEDDAAAEVYVCPEVAFEYSKKFGTTPSYELVLYMVHGMLHLAGEDDLDDEARKSMRTAEARVMGALGLRHNLEGFIL